MDEKELEATKLKDRMAYLEHRYEAMLGMVKIEHDALLRGLDMMVKDQEKVAKEKEDQKHEINLLKAQGDELTRQVSGLKKERTEMEKNSTQPEKRLADYKQKVNTLKKFKSVLDFRLREVSESLMPKEKQIETLKTQLQDAENEFETQLEEQKRLKAKMEQKEQKVNLLKMEVKQKEHVIAEKEKYIKDFENDLYTIAQTDPRTWGPPVKKLYQKYVQKERSFDQQEQRGVVEITKQMGLMEKKISSFAVKSERAELACKVDTQRKAMENSLLIHELNELRYEKKGLESKLRNLEMECKGLRAKAENAARAGTPASPAARAGALRKGVVSASRMTQE